VSANHGSGSYSLAASFKAFDRLPLSVKAAIWDGLTSWACQPVEKTCNARGPSSAANWVLYGDQEERARRKLWLRPGQCRPGTKTKDMPPTPHQAAEATQPRSFAHLYPEDTQTFLQRSRA
jgi:hypothetical protein